MPKPRSAEILYQKNKAICTPYYKFCTCKKFLGVGPSVNIRRFISLIFKLNTIAPVFLSKIWRTISSKNCAYQARLQSDAILFYPFRALHIGKSSFQIHTAGIQIPGIHIWIPGIQISTHQSSQSQYNRNYLETGLQWTSENQTSPVFKYSKKFRPS
jgi:hypothetical protein